MSLAGANTAPRAGQRGSAARLREAEAVRCRSRRGRGAPFGVRRFSCDARRPSPNPRLQLRHHSSETPLYTTDEGRCRRRAPGPSFRRGKAPARRRLSPRGPKLLSCWSRFRAAFFARSPGSALFSRRPRRARACPALLCSPPRPSQGRRRRRASATLGGRPPPPPRRELKASAKRAGGRQGLLAGNSSGGGGAGASAATSSSRGRRPGGCGRRREAFGGRSVA